MTNECIYFFESNFVGVDRLFVPVYSNQDDNTKRLKFEDITYQKEDYTTACLLDYAYIKNNYRLIAIDFSRQKELDGKAIQQIECVRQLKNTDDKNASGTQAMSILTVLEKIKETRLRFSQ